MRDINRTLRKGGAIMPRIARVVGVGLPHHITQRGNNQQIVFLDDKDRQKYLSWVQEYSDKYEVSILVYSLMLNHLHFIVIPNKEDSLAKTFKDTHTLYTQYFNKKMKRTGHLWQSRYFSCVMDERHLLAAARYIEQNPVRAKLVEKPWQWKWSSASAHINEGRSLIKLEDLFKYVDIPQSSWKEFIDSNEDKQTVDMIRKHTLTGRPLGDTSFVEKLEKKLDRRLHLLPKGRQMRD